MAIGFARIQYVKRTAGKNVVCKSAYNGRNFLEFEGNHLSHGCTYDWSHLGKTDKPIINQILLPEHVDKKFKDPKILWNAVEQFEKRKDAQIGFDFLLALPDDRVITNAMRCELAISFAQKYFVSQGYGVQVDVHAPSQRKSYENHEDHEVNERNYHAHFLITARHFDDEGISFNLKKSNDLNPELRSNPNIGGRKHVSFNILEWPKKWTQFQNEFFEKMGLDLRVDLPGVISQIHLGPVRMRSESSSRFLFLNDERKEADKVLSRDPKIILKCITENKSVFSPRDVQHFFNTHVDLKEVQAVREEFWKSPYLVELYDKSTNLPTGKFSSLHVINEEKQIIRLADRIHQRLQKRISVFAKEYSPKSLSEEQEIAFEKVTNEGMLSCIEGLAGTGKSHLLVALKDYYEAQGYKVRAFGPDNATVKVLQEKGFTDVSNVHRFLFKNHFSKKSPVKEGAEVWVIDESSKLGNTPLLELLKSAEKNHIKVIFSGNSAQLLSVERGALFRNFSERYGYAFLGDIKRQEKELHRDIAKRLAIGDVGNAVNIIASSGGFIWSKTVNESLISLVNKWAEDTLHFPFSSTLVLAHTNNEVRQLNDLIHTVRRSRGEVSNTEFECKTINGTIRVSEGDLIEIRANSKELNLFNGQRGVLIKASKNQFVIATEGKSISFDPQKFTSFQLAYAITYYRSQGSTIDRTYIHYSKLMDQKLMYVAMSRHVKNVHCFVPKTEASCITQIKKHVSRIRANENTLGFTTASEIAEMQKTQQRKNTINNLCDSENILSVTKGYSLKAYDTITTGFGSFLEKFIDRRSDDQFYDVDPAKKQTEGEVTEVKEEVPPQKEASIETELNEKIENLLHKLFPEGPHNRDNRGFRFGSNGSLAVTCVGKKKGYYHDYERGESGTLLTLIQRKEGLNKEEAIIWAKKFLNDSIVNPVPPELSIKKFKNRTEKNWISMLPPRDAPLPPLSVFSRYLDEKYNIASIYPYHNRDGTLVLYTMRLESKNGDKKIILPISYGKIHPEANPSWDMKGYLGEIPLYNSQYLKQGKPVLIVNGEKAADAAQKLLAQEYTIVTWLGGAAAAKKANWRALSGCDVIVWPCNNAAGFKAAEDIENALNKVGVKSLRIVNQETLKDLPQKWDLADPLPFDKSANFIHDSLVSAENKTLKPQKQQERNEKPSSVYSADDQLRLDLEKQLAASPHFQNLSAKKNLHPSYSKKTEIKETTPFQKLPDDKKDMYRNYFDKVEKASSLYTIVQTEASASSINKESTASFSDWQKACKERNQSAYELLRAGVELRTILGAKRLDILKDQSSRYENSIAPKDNLEAQLKDNIENLLYRLFPEGPQRQDNRGFRFGSNGSLAVACFGEKRGSYYDHEKGEGGGLLTLIQRKEGLNKEESQRWAKDFLGDSIGKTVPTHFSTSKFNKKEDDNWIGMLPPKEDTLPKLSHISRYIDGKYNFVSKHSYCNTDGSLVCYTLRLEAKIGGKKIVLPLSYGKSNPNSDPLWSLKKFRGKIPLYNSQYLNQEKPVLIVEGEKTADAAQKLLGKDYIVVTWIGGAGAAKDASWETLHNRDVVMWPDNDSGGFKAAKDIEIALKNVGVKSLRIVSQETLKDLPQKWDLADSLPSEKPANFIRDSLLRAESKAIGLHRLQSVAERNGIDFKQLNAAVCSVDHQLRSDLEKKYGAKTTEIESAILAEALKLCPQRSDRAHECSKTPSQSKEKTLDKTLRDNTLEY